MIPRMGFSFHSAKVIIIFGLEAHEVDETVSRVGLLLTASHDVEGFLGCHTCLVEGFLDKVALREQCRVIDIHHEVLHGILVAHHVTLEIVRVHSVLAANRIRLTT